MARGGGIDLGTLVLLGGGAYLLLSPQGKGWLASLRASLAAATLPATTNKAPGSALGSALPGVLPADALTTGGAGHPSGSTGGSPADPAGGAPNTGVATGSGADSATWQAYKVDLSPAGRAYIVAQNTGDGTWKFVNSPAEYGRYGIAANESNVTYVKFGSQMAFGVTQNQDPATASAFLRTDNPGGGGLDSNWPAIENQAQAVAGLRAGYAKQQIYPQGAFGLGVLHYYGLA